MRLPLPEMLALSALVFYSVSQVALFLTAGFSGWAALAAAHPCDGDCPRPAKPFCSARLGAFSSYNACLSVSADAHALHLTPWRFLLRLTHKPVALWWKDIEEIRLEGGRWRVAVRDLPDLELSLPGRSFAPVRAAAEAAGARIVEG